jgi:hypothetical protein
MGALRKDRLLREALGEQEVDMPTAEGVLLAAAVVLGLMAFIMFAG